MGVTIYLLTDLVKHSVSSSLCLWSSEAAKALLGHNLQLLHDKLAVMHAGLVCCLQTGVIRQVWYMYAQQ